MFKNVLGSINWKLRLQDKAFVVSMLGLIFLLAKQVLSIFGIDFDYTLINQQITDVINTIFVILFMLGAVKDPTTKGFSDSDQALAYDSKR
ncbi:phage holin [Enterococcus mundtii]|uniref:phage holin n=1 Tax=Enterococcus mundtii TaxID=53346 RepID=UPI001A975C25|nr:phage holin [Enterococcus mundtii]MBO1087228.1 phage holin [Enterococcus mundtii]